MPRWILTLLASSLALWMSTNAASAQPPGGGGGGAVSPFGAVANQGQFIPPSFQSQLNPQALHIGKYYYYPFHYFPHNYWPQQSPTWPEPPGAPYMKPPAYMTYPPFQEPHWRYEWLIPQRYYRGFHFWLDQF
jgi:hypothetical protein